MIFARSSASLRRRRSRRCSDAGGVPSGSRWSERSERPPVHDRARKFDRGSGRGANSRRLVLNPRPGRFARGGALDNPAPRSAWGSARATECAAAEAAATKSRAVSTCGGRLRGQDFVTLRFPRAKRGAGLSNAPPRATMCVTPPPLRGIESRTTSDTDRRAASASRACRVRGFRRGGRRGSCRRSGSWRGGGR